MTSSRIRSAAVANSAAPAAPRAASTTATRSAAAQLIRLEKVRAWTGARTSQMPASGVPATEMALRARRVSRARVAGDCSSWKRSSRNTGERA
ncbi:MAG: hypothetical protein H6Q88_2586, partial [Anaeromyxobacteraceae bacterium]|nr:hypothetical protein [Anaeromyxobacteraceae bacterium]